MEFIVEVFPLVRDVWEQIVVFSATDHGVIVEVMPLASGADRGIVPQIIEESCVSLGV